MVPNRVSILDRSPPARFNNVKQEPTLKLPPMRFTLCKKVPKAKPIFYPVTGLHKKIAQVKQS